MLVLRRQVDEGIVINDSIVVTVVDIRKNKVRLGIEAPSDVPVHRGEMHEAIRRIDGAHTSTDVEVDDDHDHG